MMVSTENKLLSQYKTTNLRQDALKKPLLDKCTKTSICSTTKNVLLEQLSRNLKSPQLLSGSLENILLKEKYRLTDTKTLLSSTENKLLKSNGLHQDLIKPTVTNKRLENPLLQSGINLASKISMTNPLLSKKSDLKFRTKNTLLAPTSNLGQSNRSIVTNKNARDFGSNVPDVISKVDDQINIKPICPEDYKDKVPFAGDVKFPPVEEVKESHDYLIQSLTISKTMLIETVCTSLINNPVWFKENDTTREKLHRLCLEISESEPEFVLKVALYTRAELHIRATCNFLLALASLMPKCRPYLKKYYAKSIILPSDWIQVAEFYQSLSNPDYAKETTALPSALRKVMVAKFPNFDEYQLGKYNKTKTKSSKKEKKKKVTKQITKDDDAIVEDDKPKLYVPSFTLKFLIRKLHIVKPARPVMGILGKKYPDNVEAFYKCGLEGTWDSALARKRMKLAVPETWETQVSAKGNIAKTWQDLLDHKKLPFMAMLRNLRNMIKAGISEKHHVQVLKTLTNERAVTKSKQFPFRFFSAYEVLTEIEREIEKQENYKKYGVRYFLIRSMKHLLDRKYSPGKEKTEEEKKVDTVKRIINKKYGKPFAFDRELIAKYRKALDTAVKIATKNNVPPIAGHTVVLCDVRNSAMSKVSTSKGLGGSRTLVEVAVLLGLMCMHSCEACTFLLCNGNKFKVVEMESGGILANLERIIQYIRIKQGQGKEDGFLPMKFFEESLINRMKMDSLLVLSSKSDQAETDTLNMFLERYKDNVNSSLMCFKVDLAGKKPNMASEKTNANILEFSGYSEQILKFVALGCAEAQLNLVASIDKRYNLVSNESKDFMMEKKAPVLYTSPRSKPWKTVRVFISSTIKDMMNERDALVQNVFPMLRERAKKMCIHVIETDLRWGITHDDSRYDRSVSICLQEVKKCDIFIAILGQRYGWVPNDYGFSEPGSEWLEDYPKSRSITELEIAQAAFKSEGKKDCFFYFRDSNALKNGVPKSLKNSFFERNLQNKNKLKELKREVENQYYPRAYRPECDRIENETLILSNMDDFEERVLNDLTEAVEKFSLSDDQQTPDHSTGQDILQDQVLSENTFVGRSFLLSSFVNKIINVKKDKGGNIVALIGKYGSGKTALLCAAYKNIVANLNNGVACIHFSNSVVGDVESPVSVIKRFCNKIISSYKILDVSMQNDVESMLGVYRKLLKRLKDLCLTVPKMFLFVDDIDMLGSDVDWMTGLLHDVITVIVTCVESGPAHKALKHISGVIFHSMPDLTLSDRREVIRSVLGKHSKKLDESHFNNQMQVLLSKQGSGNPLYLTNVCEMLRVQETFESISKTLKSLPHDLNGIMVWQLQVAENRFQKYQQLIAVILGLVYCSSKWGIAEEDLYEALCLRYGNPYSDNGSIRKALPKVIMYAALRAMKSFLVFYKSGEGTFLSLGHAIHKKLVEDKYISDDQLVKNCHSTLASLYTVKLREITSETKDEALAAVAVTKLPTHLALSEQKEVLEKLLSDFAFVVLKCRLGLGKQLLTDYLLLEEKKETKVIIKRSQQKTSKHPWKEMYAFLKSCIHIISRCPEMIYQVALNYHKDSYPYSIASKLLSVTESGKGFNVIFIEQAASYQNDHQLSIQTYGEEIVNDTRICIATHPQSEFIAWGSKTGKVGVFHKNSSNEVYIWSGHSTEVTVLYFINKAMLVSASADGMVSVWNTAEGYRVQSFSAHRSKVSSISVQPLRQGSAGRVFATSSYDQSIAFWNVSNLKLVNRIQTNGSCVNCIDFHPNEARVVTGLWDSSIRIWDVRTSKRVAVIRGHLMAVSAVQYSVCGTYIASCSEFESVIRLWAAGAGIPLGNFGETYLTSSKSLTFTHNGDYLIGAGESTNECVSKLAVWNSHLGKKEFSYWVPDAQEYGNTTCCSFNKDKTMLAVGFHEGYISIYDPLLPYAIFTEKIYDSAVTCLAWTPSADLNSFSMLFDEISEEILITGSVDCNLKAIDPNSKSVIAIFQGHTAPVSAADCCENWVASGSEDFDILLWKTEDIRGTTSFSHSNVHVQMQNLNNHLSRETIPRIVKHSVSLQSHEGPVSCLAFDPNGAMLVSGGRDGKIAFWNISCLNNSSSIQMQQQVQSSKTKKDIRPIAVIDQAHMDWITCCSWNDTSSHIVTGSNDSTLKVWSCPNLDNIKKFSTSPLNVLKGHQSGITSVVYRFGCIVSTGGEDCTIKIWSHKGVEITSLKIESRTNSCDIALQVKSDEEEMTDVYDDLDNKEEADFIWADEVEKEEWDEEHEKRKPGAKRKLKAAASDSLQNFGVVCASNNAEISLWKPLVGNSIASMNEQAKSVNQVSVSGDCEIVSCSSNGSIKLWNVEVTSGELRHNGEVTSIISFENVVVSSCDAGFLYIWDLSMVGSNNLKMTCKAKAHKKRITAMCYLKGMSFATVSYDTNLIIWTVGVIGHGNKENQFSLQKSCMMSLEGKLISLSVGQEKGGMILWAGDMGGTTSKIKVEVDLSKVSLLESRNSENERLTVFCDENSGEIEWISDKGSKSMNLEKGEFLHSFTKEAGTKSRILSGSSNGYLYIKENGTKKKIHNSRVTVLLDSKDFLLSGSHDCTVKIWNKPSLNQIGQFLASSPVTSACFLFDKCFAYGDSSGLFNILKLHHIAL